MNEIIKKETKAKEIVEPVKEFKGYTIEEIRFKRALVAMEADFCKTKMIKSWGNIQEANPLTGGNKTSFTGKAGAIAMKMVSGLNYLDYILLGVSVFKGTRKMISLFRGKKK